MKHDAKLMKKRGKNLEKLVEVLELLASGNPLPQKYKDHQLTGNLNDFRECHIEPDWLLMYQIFENELILSVLFRRGNKYCHWKKKFLMKPKKIKF